MRLKIKLLLRDTEPDPLQIRFLAFRVLNCILDKQDIQEDLEGRGHLARQFLGVGWLGFRLLYEQCEPLG